MGVCTDFYQYLLNLISACKNLTDSSGLGSVMKPRFLKWEILAPQCSQGFVLVIFQCYVLLFLGILWTAFAHHEQIGHRMQVILGWCLV